MLELQDTDDCIKQEQTGLLKAAEYNQILTVE